MKATGHGISLGLARVHGVPAGEALRLVFDPGDPAAPEGCVDRCADHGGGRAPGHDRVARAGRALAVTVLHASM